MKFELIRHLVFENARTNRFTPNSDIYRSLRWGYVVWGSLRKYPKIKGLYDLHHGVRIDKRIFGFFVSNMDDDEVEKKLRKKGFRLLHQSMDFSISNKKHKYATGLHKEGEIIEWSGTVYHGTGDPLFFTNKSNELKFGGQHSELSASIKDGFSTTTKLLVAAEFSNYGSIIIEYKVNKAKIYHLPGDQYQGDFLNVDHDEFDAVAIPETERYKESEIVFTNPEGGYAKPIAVLAASNKHTMAVNEDVWKRIPIKIDEARSDPWNSYLKKVALIKTTKETVVNFEKKGDFDENSLWDFFQTIT